MGKQLGKGWRAFISMTLLSATCAVLLMAVFLVFMKFGSHQIHQDKVLMEGMLERVGELSEKPEEQLKALADFRENNPEIERSAAFWLLKTSAYEMLGQTENAGSAFRDAIDAMRPNDLRLFLRIRFLNSGEDAKFRYAYRKSSGEAVNLSMCMMELEGEYLDLREGAGENGTLLGSLSFIAHVAFPDIFANTCPEIETDNRA